MRVCLPCRANVKTLRTVADDGPEAGCVADPLRRRLYPLDASRLPATDADIDFVTTTRTIDQLVYLVDVVGQRPISIIRSIKRAARCDIRAPVLRRSCPN